MTTERKAADSTQEAPGVAPAANVEASAGGGPALPATQGEGKTVSVELAHPWVDYDGRQHWAGAKIKVRASVAAELRGAGLVITE
jgi:hypothetical protein